MPEGEGATVALDQLRDGARDMGVDLDTRQATQLIAFLDLFERWNRVHNLSGIRDAPKMLSTHLLDSLAAVATLKRLAARHIADVGSGGGLPGIPLAIALPDVEMTLIEKAPKKVAFQIHASTVLGLENVYPLQVSVQALTITKTFECIVSRAFAEAKALVEAAKHLLGEDGSILAYKGPRGPLEGRDLPAGWRLRETIWLRVPGIDAKRCLLVIGKDEQRHRARFNAA